MFSLYFAYFVILVISRFGFEGWVWVLIASVPGLCILFTIVSLAFLPRLIGSLIVVGLLYPKPRYDQCSFSSIISLLLKELSFYFLLGPKMTRT